MKKINVSFSKSLQHKLKSLLKHYQTKQYVDAEKLSVSITQEFPEHQLAWKVLAAVLMQTGRLSESLIPSQKSAELEPTDSEAHYNLGITLQDLGRLEEAMSSYKKAITLKPDLTEAHNNLGVIVKELGKLEKRKTRRKRRRTRKKRRKRRTKRKRH